MAYYLLKELAAGVDLLGPENLLILANGTFTGLGRTSMGGKSRLTGGVAEAEASGFF